MGGMAAKATSVRRRQAQADCGLFQRLMPGKRLLTQRLPGYFLPA